MLKHLISIMLTVIIAAYGSIPTVALDSEVDVRPFLKVPNNEESITSVTSFSREYTHYFSLYNTVEVMSDPNWDILNDTVVTVSVTASEGPSVLQVTIYYKEDDATTWTRGDTGTLHVNESISCSIPEDYSIKVEATSLKGDNGNATLMVALS